jgi:hypothetical protein
LIRASRRDTVDAMRGSTGVRILACLILVAGGLGGCQPLYGGKPEKLANPSKKKRPPEPEQAEVKITYVEECKADFRGESKIRPQPSIAERLIQDGESAMQSARQAKDAKSEVDLIRVAIDKYRNALLKDPFNAEATLGLALAYDRVLRKGCALALLKRIAALEENPKYASGARRAADLVTDNNQWFKGYRNEAISAVGR